MHALFRLISRYLLLVMLATVLTPSFGLEAVAAVEREPVAVHGMHDHHAGHEMPVADQESEACSEVQHHCCIGHQLAHPQGNALSLILPEVSAIVPHFQSARFLTRVPEGLERPPRALSV